MSNRTARFTPPPALRLEQLEAREVPAVLIQIDYTYDTGFFTNNPQARATMELVASELGNSIDANLAAIAPDGANSWSASFYNPSTGALQVLANPTIGANTIRVYVGARFLAGEEAGYAATTGFDAAGSAGWIDTVQTRGHSGFSPWGGSISFDTDRNWFFGTTTAGLTSSKLDFYSVATHELGHILGIGTSDQWKGLSSGGYFHGGNATTVYGGAVPLGPDGIHWADGVALGGQSVSLDPSVAYGHRVTWTALDAAALRDLGWGAAATAGPAGPVVLMAIAGADGVVTQYAIYNGGVFATGQQWDAFPGYRGAVQQAYGDFDGDGTYDVAVATPSNLGFGAVAIVSGLDGHYIGAPRYTLGGAVAALITFDADGDGRPELLTAEGTPIGFYIYSASGGALNPYTAVRAYGTPGRAALLAPEGDVKRTGYGDVVSGAPEAEPVAARLDAPSGTGANYTASAAPVHPRCTCAGCTALAGLGGAEKAAAALPPGVGSGDDELLSAIRVG